MACGCCICNGFVKYWFSVGVRASQAQYTLYIRIYVYIRLYAIDMRFWIYVWAQHYKSPSYLMTPYHITTTNYDFKGYVFPHHKSGAGVCNSQSPVVLSSTRQGLGTSASYPCYFQHNQAQTVNNALIALFCMSTHRIEGAYTNNSYITCNVCNHDLPDLHEIAAEGPCEFWFD